MRKHDVYKRLYIAESASPLTFARDRPSTRSPAKAKHRDFLRTVTVYVIVLAGLRRPSFPGTFQPSEKTTTITRRVYKTGDTSSHRSQTPIRRQRYGHYLRDSRQYEY